MIRRAPRSRVVIHELTTSGHDLEPVVLPLGAWRSKAIGDPRDEQVVTSDSLTMSLRIRVDGPTLDVTRNDGPVDLASPGGRASCG